MNSEEFTRWFDASITHNNVAFKRTRGHPSAKGGYSLYSDEQVHVSFDKVFSLWKTYPKETSWWDAVVESLTKKPA